MLLTSILICKSLHNLNKVIILFFTKADLIKRDENFIFGVVFYDLFCASVYTFLYPTVEPFWNRFVVSYEFYALFKLNVIFTVGEEDFRIIFSISIII